MIGQTSIAAIRFGYGLPVPAAAPATPADMLAHLVEPDAMAGVWPIPGLAAVEPLLARIAALRKQDRKAAKSDPAYLALAEQALALPQQALRATMARALDAEDGFRERLVAFWADHFTVVGRGKFDGILPYALVEDAIRPQLTGNFAAMLTAVTLHPAMLLYLDQSSSVGPNSLTGRRRQRGLNENLAREVIELHSLGVGAAYSQDDVHQMAELLTGLGYDVQAGMVFHPNWAEPGAETVLGKHYGGDGLVPINAALADLAGRPETAAHLARKLAVHFVADQPDPDLVAAVTAALRDSGGDLLAGYAALLGHPAAWLPQREKVRQPYDFLVASLRALGISGTGLMALDDKAVERLLERPMRAMGQPAKMPPGPNGWPEEAAAWITPQGLAQRISWAMQVPKRLLRPLPDPVTFVDTCLADAASADLRLAVARSEDVQQGVGLVLASSDFNRR
jgi:uncharacterized protein (DUF1800 family)